MKTSGIDFVIYWVDGGDLIYRGLRDAYQNEADEDQLAHFEQSLSDLRFHQANELKYCLRSVVNHAPWYRNIWLVVDNQWPDFLDEARARELRICSLDHSDFFAGSSAKLPTFSSRALTAQLSKCA